MPPLSTPLTRSSSNFLRNSQSSVVSTPASSITPSDSISEVLSDTTTTARTSWVWQYFVQEEVSGLMKNVCRAQQGFIDIPNAAETSEAPAICNKALALDKHASTKSMSRHLSRAHYIDPPIQTSQPTVAGLYIDRVPIQVRPLNRANLKEALIRLVVNREVPISFVDASEFREIINMINPAAYSLLSKRTAISEGIMDSFRSTRAALTNLLSTISHISITCDGWTSPTNVAMLGVTAHWISEDFQLRGITLALKPIDGPHTGANLATILKHILDSFHISDRLYCITADNASNNTTMGQSLSALIPQFDAAQNLHGCVAHVINLVAKAGMSVFDRKDPPPPINALDPSIPQSKNGVPLFIEPTSPSELGSILTRIRGYHRKIKHSSQLKTSLDNTIASCAKLDRKVGLVHEVSTRWSSTHASLSRFVELKVVLEYQFNSNPSLECFQLDCDEWALVENLVQFLSPLATVTKTIEGHLYPTFSVVMPDYQWLVNRLEMAWVDSRCQELKVAIMPMVKKILQYQEAAQKKAVYICSAILDPRLKLTAVKGQTMESLGWGQEDLIEYFTDHASKFKPALDPDVQIIEPPEEYDPDQPQHYIKRRKTVPIEHKVTEYLTAPQEDEVCKPLVYWQINRRHWPNLARMAKAMLAVPATSAPSESTFSNALRVMSDHRASFTASNLEAQVCLKSWNKVSSM